MGKRQLSGALGFWLLLTSAVSAQTPALDTLRRTAEQQYQQGNTTAGIHQYADLIKQSIAAGHRLPLAADFNRLAEMYESLDTLEGNSRALSARQEAVNIYEAEGDRDRAAATLVQMVANADEMGQRNLGADYRGQAIAHYVQLSDRDQIAILAFEQGQFLAFTDDVAKAYPYLEQAIAAAEAIDSPELPKMLRFAATVAVQNNDPTRGFTWFDRLIAHHKTRQEWQAYAETNLQVGRTHQRKGDPRESLRYFEAAAQGFRKAGQTANALNAHQWVAEYHMSAENLAQALATYEQAVQLAETVGNPVETAWLFYQMGQLHRRLQQAQDSVDYYHRALKLYQTSPRGGWNTYNTTPEQIANLTEETLKQLQAVYETLLDQPEAALKVAQQRVELRQAGDDRVALKNALVELARTHENFGQNREAIAVYERLVDLRNQDLENLENYAFLTETLAEMHQKVGDSEAAIARVEADLKLYRQVNDRRRVGQTLATLSELYFQLGETERHQDIYAEAMAIAQETNDYLLQGALRIQLANLRYEQRDFEGAVALLEDNLRTARTINNARSEAIALEELGQFYSPWTNTAVVDVAQAFDYYTQARRVLAREDDDRAIVSNLEWVGNLAWFEGDLKAASDYFRQALTAAEKSDSPVAQIDSLVALGQLAVGQNQAQTAIAYLQKAQAQNTRQTWKILKYQGDAYRQLQQLDRALEYYEQSLLVSSTRSFVNQSGIGVWWQYLDTWSAMAQVHRDRNEYTPALAQIQKVINEVETYSRRLKNPDARQSFFTKVQGYYDLYIDILMRLHQQQPSQGYDQQALQADERRRTQGLLGLLTEANVDLRKGVDPGLLQREAEMLERLEALEMQRVAALTQATDPLGIETERDRLLEQYENIQNQIRAANPQYAQIQYPQALTLQEIQQLLDPETVLLQYTLGEQQSVLWVVSQASIESHVLPSRAAFEKLTRTFNRRLRSASVTPERLYSDAIAISTPLLRPIAGQLQGKRLLVVSDGALQYMPFGALTQPDSSTYDPLVNHHEIISLPSMSTLATLRATRRDRPTPRQTLAIMADPVFGNDDARVAKSGSEPKLLSTRQVSRAAQDVGIDWSRLPGTRQEAQNILGLLPEAQTQAHFGFAATKAQVFEDAIARAKYVHFATHGFVNTHKPQLSGIVMSLLDEDGDPQNGFLRLNDVYNLDLAAALVVLSACDTGTGALVRGEGLIGLTRGFMYAGAERVVASLWQVDDAATAALMSEFYRQLITEQAEPAEALRKAQQAIASQPQWSAPFYWAAFTLQGDW